MQDRRLLLRTITWRCARMPFGAPPWRGIPAICACGAGLSIN